MRRAAWLLCLGVGLSAMAACGLNPQPELPSDNASGGGAGGNATNVGGGGRGGASGNGKGGWRGVGEGGDSGPDGKPPVADAGDGGEGGPVKADAQPDSTQDGATTDTSAP